MSPWPCSRTLCTRSRRSRATSTVSSHSSSIRTRGVDANAAKQLAQWRREVGELYGQVRALGASDRAGDAWRQGKERLYREHPQPPVAADRRAAYHFACFSYDPALHVLAELARSVPRHIDGDHELPGMTHIGTLGFAVDGAGHELGAYWLDGYAGGFFVPFADSTSGSETYGGGRHALATSKGAGPGIEGGRIVVAFTFANTPAW